MTTRTSNLVTIGFVLITLSLGIVQLNLIAAQSVFFLAAAIVWVIVVAQDGGKIDAPPFFLPLLVYAGLTLLSAAVSGHAAEGLWDSRQLLMFLMVPIVARFAQGDRATKTMDVIIAIGAAGAVVGIFQFAILHKGDLDNRLKGLLGHWMTFSGVLMLTTCAAVARITFTRMRSPWPLIAVPALLVALIVTNTRNAWIGTFLAVCTLLGIKNWKLVIVAPVLAALAFLVAPGMVKARAASLLNPSDPASRDRIVMWKIGADMVRDHPMFGLGPHRLQEAYPDYRQKYPEAVNPTNPHLHNVPIQIAAERGLPALAAWLWFIVVAARDLWRQVRARVAPAVAGAGLAALVAMLAAGMFEYNFGDSEFLMLFLGLLTLPYAAARGAVSPASPVTSSRSGASRA
jgi:O-antigen ligase